MGADDLDAETLKRLKREVEVLSNPVDLKFDLHPDPIARLLSAPKSKTSNAEKRLAGPRTALDTFPLDSLVSIEKKGVLNGNTAAEKWIAPECDLYSQQPAAD